MSPIDHDRVLSPPEQRTIERRSELIERLLEEIREPANGPASLYASLLARTLAGSDELLARRHSRAVAAATN